MPRQLFYVELYLLSNYFQADHLHAGYLGIATIDFGDLIGEHECEGIIITPDDSADESCLYLYCFDGDGCHSGPNHTLVATYEDNVVYWREAWHNPHTEWNINELANNIEDEAGDFVFPGEHVQI